MMKSLTQEQTSFVAKMKPVSKKIKVVHGSEISEVINIFFFEERL